MLYLNEDLKVIFGEIKKWLWLVIVLAPCVYLLSGFYSVDVDQRAFVTRFGKLVQDNVRSGMHYHFPWPFEQATVFDTPALKSKVIEFVELDKKNRTRSLELITGDGNLVDAVVELQYSVAQTMRFVTASKDVDLLLEALAKAEIIYHISNNNFENIITTGRNQLQNQVKSGLQNATDTYDLGVRVTGVQIKLLEPPKSIRKTFDDVSSAQSEKQKTIQEARGERGAKLAKSRSEANRTKSNARAHSNELLRRAEGDVDRFASQSELTKASERLLRQRQYMDSLEQVFKEVELVLIAPER